MANESNLIPNEKRTPEERRENAKKAGKASAKKRKQNKTFAELCNAFANSKITNAEFKEKMGALGIKDEEMTNKTAMMVSLYMQALRGNVKAFEVYRDTMGEKPKDNINISGEVNNPFSGMTTEELRKILNE